MDRAELRRLAESAINHPTINVPLDCGTADIPSLAMEAYQEEVSNPSAIIELLDKLEAAEKVCEAVQKLSDLYNGEIDTIHEQLYNRWRELDDALDKWQGVK